jgi:hypothetical protein
MQSTYSVISASCCGLLLPPPKGLWQDHVTRRPGRGSSSTIRRDRQILHAQCRPVPKKHRRAGSKIGHDQSMRRLRRPSRNSTLSLGVGAVAPRSGHYSSSGRAAGFFASCGSVLAPGRPVSGLLRSSERFLASGCGVPERGGVFTHVGTTPSTLLLLEQPASRAPKIRSATRRDIYLPAQGSILPEVPKPVGRQLHIAQRVLDIFVSKIAIQAWKPGQSARPTERRAQQVHDSGSGGHSLWHDTAGFSVLRVPRHRVLQGASHKAQHRPRMSVAGGRPENMCEAPGDRQGVEGASPLR